MSEVTLTVGGRNYTVACADGQEDHVRHLAGVVDGKLAEMGASRTTMEAKNLLFAALHLADELEESASASASPTPPASSIDLADGLERIADRLEKTAELLEGGPATS